MPGKVIVVKRAEKLGLLERLYVPMIVKVLEGSTSVPLDCENESVEALPNVKCGTKPVFFVMPTRLFVVSIEK